MYLTRLFVPEQDSREKGRGEGRGKAKRQERDIEEAGVPIVTASPVVLSALCPLYLGSPSL